MYRKVITCKPASEIFHRTLTTVNFGLTDGSVQENETCTSKVDISYSSKFYGSNESALYVYLEKNGRENLI